jgi:hypothetical protein
VSNEIICLKTPCWLDLHAPGWFVIFLRKGVIKIAFLLPVGYFGTEFWNIPLLTKSERLRPICIKIHVFHLAFSLATKLSHIVQKIGAAFVTVLFPIDILWRVWDFCLLCYSNYTDGCETSPAESSSNLLDNRCSKPVFVIYLDICFELILYSNCEYSK